MRRSATLALLALACGRTPVYSDPGMQTAQLSACETGGVRGRLCAPDQKTFINGAAISVQAVDCHGARVERQTTTEADGSFELDGVPIGPWVVHAAIGSFSQDLPVVFTTDVVEQLPDGAACIAQRNVHIAVVTGNGDRIETLLTSLGLEATLFGGNNGVWGTHGALFLSDLAEMQQFDIIFVDCAAAVNGSYDIDLGDSSALIESNLHTFVAEGGELYASDWALLFSAYAAPGAFDFVTSVPNAVASPLDTTSLMGFAPQTLNATVTDPGLADFLGKSTLAINFPHANGAVATHWGLMNGVDGGTVLASADGVITCGNYNCNVEGPIRDSVPLAVRLDVGKGSVVYTSFHNIAQNGDDVAKLLKYLVLRL